MTGPDNGPMVTAPELARTLRVNPRTPSRWVRAGLVPADAWFRTPGGHLRFWLHRLPLDDLDDDET